MFPKLIIKGLCNWVSRFSIKGHIQKDLRVDITPSSTFNFKHYVFSFCFLNYMVHIDIWRRKLVTPLIFLPPPSFTSHLKIMLNILWIQIIQMTYQLSSLSLSLSLSFSFHFVGIYSKLILTQCIFEKNILSPCLPIMTLLCSHT